MSFYFIYFLFFSVAGGHFQTLLVYKKT